MRSKYYTKMCTYDKFYFKTSISDTAISKYK